MTMDQARQKYDLILIQQTAIHILFNLGEA